jgi:RHS repeat-associated protein
MINPQGNKLEFTYDPAGRLPLYGSSPFSLDPEQVSIVAYDYRLTKISERLANGTVTGNEVTLSYHPSGHPSEGRLSKIKATAPGDQREVTYIHDATSSAKNGNLLTVNGLEGIVSTYVYNDLADDGNTIQDPHNVTSIQIGTGRTPFVNEYDDKDRVKKQTYGHHVIDFDYQTGQFETVVTQTIKDQNGLILNTLETKYKFNVEGYATEIQNTLDGGTQYRVVYTRNSNNLITQERTYEKPAGENEFTVRTLKHTYDGNNNVASTSVTLDSGEIITTTRTFDGYWLSRKKTTSSLRPTEIFQTDYTFHYDPSTGYPTNIKETKRRRANGTFLTTTYTYNDNGQLTETKLPDGHEIINVYTGEKLTKTYHKIAGNESPYLKQQFAYDDQDNLSQVTNARGYATSFVTDDLGRVIQVTNAKDEETHFRYDTAYLGGTVLREVERGRIGVTEGQIVRFGYGAEGWRQLIERQKDNGDWLAVQSATHNSIGRPLTSSVFRDGTPLTSTMSYDALGRLLTSSDPATPQNTTQYEYDALGNTVAVVDAKLREMHYTYDDNNRLIAIHQDATGINATTLLSYDAADNLLTVTDPEDSVTTYTYDRLSRRTTVTQPLGAPHQVFTVYDERNRIDYLINARFQKIDYTYEPWGALKEKRYFESQNAQIPNRTVTFEYDYNGNVAAVTDDAIQFGEFISFTYDELDREDVVTAKYLPSIVTLDSDYDQYGNRDRLTLDDGATQHFDFTYNKLNQLSSVGFPGGRNPSVTYYEDLGLYKQLQLASGITTNYLYYDNGPIEQIKITKSDSTLIEQLDYVYDAVLNVETQTSFQDGGAHTYGYNSQDSLTSADHPAPQIDEFFDYDMVGNRETPGNLALYDYNANHQIQVSPTDIIYEFDEDGNLRSKTKDGSTESFVHNPDNRLIEYNDGTTTTVYRYDSFGRRISKNVSGEVTHFLWDGSRLLGEYTNTGARGKRYHHLPGGLNPSQFEDQGAIYDIHLNHVQTPEFVTDQSEATVWSQTQQVFGDMTVSSGIDLNLRFPGQYFDFESGIHYNYFRYYDPSTGRYIQSDPIGLYGGLNTYAYVSNQPIRYTDPSGLYRGCRLIRGTNGFADTWSCDGGPDWNDGSASAFPKATNDACVKQCIAEKITNCEPDPSPGFYAEFVQSYACVSAVVIACSEKTCDQCN